MKISEVIQLALDTNYVRDYDVNRKNDVYMCHAVAKLNVPPNTQVATLQYIDSLLFPMNCITLGVFLARSNKLYNSYDKRFGFNSKVCFNMRVKFWKDTILKLQEKGM